MSTISNAYLDSLRVAEETVKVDDGTNQTLDQEDFLHLLTQQLAMQDPSEPVDNNTMVSQMASFSTVEGISQMTAQFEDLNSVMTSSQALQASTLVGQKVLIPASVGHVEAPGASVDAVISLPESATSVTVNIENEAGELIKTMKMANLPAGNNDFTWDGTDENGDPVEAGNYTIQALSQVDGEEQELAVSTYSHVASVSLNTANGVILNLRGLGNISLNEVLAVSEA